MLGIRDGYPGSRILMFFHPLCQISDPGSHNKKEEDIFLSYLFCSYKVYKIENYIFEQEPNGTEEIVAN
jgi:hypothetical protein